MYRWLSAWQPQEDPARKSDLLAHPPKRSSFSPQTLPYPLSRVDEPSGFPIALALASDSWILGFFDSLILYCSAEYFPASTDTIDFECFATLRAKRGINMQTSACPSLNKQHIRYIQCTSMVLDIIQNGSHPRTHFQILCSIVKTAVQFQKPF